MDTSDKERRPGDYITGMDGRALVIEGKCGPEYHCYHVNGRWPNGATSTGIIHAKDTEDARRILSETRLASFDVLLSY